MSTALGFVALTAGCAAPRQAKVNSPPVLYETLRDKIDRHEFHTAFLLLDKVMEEMKDVPEGAAGYERNNLMAMTALWGRHQWDTILSDPRIPLEHKRELVEEIHDVTSR